MDFMTLGPWLVATLAIPAAAASFVAALALRGTKPHQRAAILIALAAFASALLLRGGPGRRSGSGPDDDGSDEGSAERPGSG